MTIFELVKIALDEIYQEGKERYGEGLDTKVKDEIQYLLGSYKDLTSDDRTPINYKDPATRFAYVFKYTASHGDYVIQVLEAARQALTHPVFTGDTLRVSCVGGGPGSDLIGILKYLSEYTDEPTKKITCYLLDGEQAWADTWTEIGDSIQTSVSLNVNFQPLDVTKPDSWSAQKRFLQSDIFTLSYFVSEVYAVGEEITTAFLSQLFEDAKIGALFLYVDNGCDTFNEYFDKLWIHRGDIEAIVEGDNNRFIPHFTEQASELGDYREKFGSPKLQSRLSYRVLRKVSV